MNVLIARMQHCTAQQGGQGAGTGRRDALLKGAWLRGHGHVMSLPGKIHVGLQGHVELLVVRGVEWGWRVLGCLGHWTPPEEAAPVILSRLLS